MNSMNIPDQAQNLIDETVSMADASKKMKGRVTFVNNPVKTFGILFNHAFALDVSITKYCFQGCPFCFATANKRYNQDVIGKNEDPTDLFIRMLQKANGQGYNPDNIQEYILHKKYPIIFSNNVDPFMPASEEKYKLGERILEACLDYKQRLFIQTKEVFYGDKVRDLLIKGKDLFQVYVSLSTLDYDIAKRYETVAVTPETRLQRIKTLTDAGVHVVVAANPYVPEWIKSMREYASAVKNVGASGIFAYPLHLTHAQKKMMPKRFAPFTDKADRYVEFHEDMKLMQSVCDDLGLKLYFPRQTGNHGYYKGSTVWKMPDEVWPIDAHWFIEDIHKIWEEEQKPIMFGWSQIDKFYSKFPEWKKVFSMNQFAGVLWTDNETFFHVKSTLGSKQSIRNIVRYIFNNPTQQDHFLQFYTDVFQVVDGGGKKEGEVELVLDDNDDAVYVYDPSYKLDPFYWDQSDPRIGDNFVELE